MVVAGDGGGVGVNCFLMGIQYKFYKIRIVWRFVIQQCEYT